jgi:replicative DNA helicase
MSGELLRVAPSNLEVEEAVLGTVLIEGGVIDDVVRNLIDDDFYNDKHKVIFQAMKEMYDNNDQIDVLTVVAKLKSKSLLERAGGMFFVNKLTSNINSSAHIESHCHILKSLGKSRRVISSFRESVDEAYNGSDPDDIIDKASKVIFDIQKDSGDNDISSVGDLSEEVIRRVEEASKSDGGITGEITGISAIDTSLNGLNPGNLVVIAARPGMGKTALIISMARNMAIDYNAPVALFSLEMTKVDFTKRLHANHCLIDNNKLKTGRLTENEWTDYHSELSDLLTAGIYIDETPSLKISDLRVKARQLVMEKGVKAIFIDYLQLMGMPKSRELGTRDLQIGFITTSLKRLAKELGIPIILLSQLSRGVEHRDDKRPMLSDLRESGNIEQDADAVLFLYRPSYYDEKAKDEHGMPLLKTYSELVIAKNRDGFVGIQPMHFIGEYFKFQNDPPAYAEKPTMEEVDVDDLKDEFDSW